MSIDQPQPTSRSHPPAQPDEPSPVSMPGWLSAIRTRLGLPGNPTLRDTIEYALKQGTGPTTAFSPEERNMLARLLRFGKIRVEDIMVPRADIIAVDETDSINTLLTTFEEAGVSRVPVFTGTLDDPHGMIHIKDLFRWLLEDAIHNGPSNGADNKTRNARTQSAPKARAKSNGAAPKNKKSTTGEPTDNSATRDLGMLDLSRPISIAKIHRPVLFVPPSMPAMSLLVRMQSTRNHMALVVDEYGGTDGLITIEDLVEQIVGDIEDEHDDAEETHIVHDPKHGLVASARTPLEELEAHLNRKLVTAEQEEEIDTLGGLVFAIVGRVPARGEIVRHPTGIEFEILDADPRRIKTLKVHVPDTVETLDDALSARAAETS